MTADSADRFSAAASVANAVLYEGYVLYPYRASACKNQMRWQFGVLTPRAYSETEGSERSMIHTECILDPGTDAVLYVRVRCLQVQRRSIEEVVSADDDSDVHFVGVGQLEAGDASYVGWDEAVEHCVDLPPIRVGSLLVGAFEHRIALEGGAEPEMLAGADGVLVGRILRERHRVEAVIRVEAQQAAMAPDLVVVAVTVENTTAPETAPTRRDEALGYSLVAVHTMMAVDDGRFVSLLDPPDRAVELAAQRRNEGAYPVLVGDDLVLSSPIILYDHPQVAPESPGDLYDSTEIDEILALRVLTLTDAEKSEARRTDPRAAAIVDRCDAMSPDAWSQLHGEMRALPSTDVGARTDDLGEVPVWDTAGVNRSAWWDPDNEAAVDPWSDDVLVNGVKVTKGVAVRLRPWHRADAQDLFLAGRTATVTGVFTDAEGEQHIAVTVDDDPANEELAWQGRYLFFHPDEVEPLDIPTNAAAAEESRSR